MSLILIRLVVSKNNYPDKHLFVLKFEVGGERACVVRC